ncbi:40S ribosomal protein S11 [Verticillium dahliae VDG1]|nr:40S ribosomal protein S11 [Verticillium dahliae VDG1]
MYDEALRRTLARVNPHSLPPEAVIKGHLHPPLAHAYSHLSAALQNTRMENEDLFTTIQAQRAEMDALLADLDGVVADIDGANDLLGQVAPELAAEARKADSGIAGM